MFLWAVEASTSTHVKCEKIWKRLEDVQHWPLWDDTLEAAYLDGPFVVGATGWLQRKGAVKYPFKITFLEKNDRFGMVMKRFSTTIACTCQIKTHQDGSTTITFRVIVGGLLAPIYRLSTAKKLKKSLPRTLAALMRL